MPDPTLPSAAAVAVTAGAASVAALQAAPAIAPQLVVFGYALGLRADVLVAGFAGSVVALTFFNSVPSTGDTLRRLVETTLRRMWWCLASSLTSGYLTPLVLLPAPSELHIPEALMYSVAFVVGAGAQRILGRFLQRAEERIASASPAGVNKGDEP
jgi:hypothetical protein